MDKQTKHTSVGDIFFELNEIEKALSKQKDNETNNFVETLKAGPILSILCC